MQAQPNLPLTFSTPYPHFPSMTMPLPQGLGGAVPFPPPTLPVPVSAAQAIPADDRRRIERERWVRMDVLYQSIRHNVNQFEYPAPSVAALESVLVRMYFESPISAPQNPQPHLAAYPVTNHPQQPEDSTADRVNQSDGSSESGDDDDDDGGGGGDNNE